MASLADILYPTGWRPVLKLPVDWVRDTLDDGTPSFFAICKVEGPAGDLSKGFELVARVTFSLDLAAWSTFVSCNGMAVYSSEHRERDEACGACVVAMQRALDVRHPQ